MNKHGITAAAFLVALVLGVALWTVGTYGESIRLAHAKEQPASPSHLQPSNQATKSFVVDSDGDEDDVRLGDGQCGTKLVEDRTEACTLRASIQEAHASTGVGEITSASRIIQVLKPLPIIQNPLELNLNGTTIDGSRLDTQASGLHIRSEETIVRGVVIHRFSGDGILYEGPGGSPLTLVNVESSGNCGWGLRISDNPLVVHGTLRTTGNGAGEGCEAGGLLVQGDITDASDGFVETIGNNGPGLVAHKDISISLLGFESSDNKGPGIQRLFGSITVTQPNDASSSLTVKSNEGPGMLAGLDLAFDVASDDDPGDEPLVQNIVVLGMPINVENNGSWGILASGAGDVFLNVNPETNLPMSLAGIDVSSNGDPDKGCRIYTEDGDLELPQDDCGGGGIGVVSGKLYAATVNVSSNIGPGIAAAEDVSLGILSATGNQGPGVQSIFGSITIEPVTDDSASPNPKSLPYINVEENQGPGLLAGSDSDFAAEGDDDSDEDTPPQNITIKGSIWARRNGSWGILSTGHGDIFINVDPIRKDPPSPGVSEISGNGQAVGCFFIDGEGDLVTPIDECRSGGIGAAAGNIHGAGLEVVENQGPGVVAAEDISLTGVISNGNIGPGVQSLFGAISISIGGTEETGILEVIENQGPGIFAGTDLDFVTDGESDDSENESDHNIAIANQIKVSDNGAWGILSISGDVFVNVDPDGHRALPGLVSEIGGNGNPDLNCWILGEEGDPVTPDDGCNDGGGIGAPGGNIYLARVDVRRNLGPGVAAAEDIDIRGIEAHFNQGPGIQSLFGSITIAPGGTPDEAGIFINNNQGPGIFTGADTLFDPGEVESSSEENPPQSIVIKTPIQVSGNGGWGIFAEENGDVFINVDPADMTGSLFPMESVISENGNPNHGCLFLDDAGELVTPSGRCDTGGVGAGQGHVFAALVDISSNNGPGVATGGDVNIREGNLCENTTDLIRFGESHLNDATVCKETTSSDFLREVAASAPSEEMTAPAPTADPTIQPTEDPTLAGEEGESQAADDSAGGGGGCNAFAGGLIYVDGSWVMLGILSLGMVFARLRKDRRP
ncbi:MAG: hypothetical protein CMJ45_08630 [Planctomyces sp.]|nr:hypothetical protein [Planctomyces sp.]